MLRRDRRWGDAPRVRSGRGLRGRCCGGRRQPPRDSRRGRESTPSASMASRSFTIWQAPSSAYLALSSLEAGVRLIRAKSKICFCAWRFSARMWSAARQPEALVGLGHQVADVDLGGRRLDDRLGNSAHQQIGNQAGEERSGADGDQVSIGNRFQRLRHRAYVGRNEKQFADASFAGGDFSFSAHPRAVFHQGFEFNVRRRRGINMAASQQNL